MMRTYRGSELGRCVRASVAAQLGMSPMPPPEWLQRMFDGGNDHEGLCLDAMRADGWDIGGEQALVVLSLTPDTQIEGHLDGGCTHSDFHRFGDGPERSVLEIKSPSAWSRFEKAYKTDCWDDPLCARYAWQLSAYQHGMGMEAVVACLDGDRVRTFGIEVPIHSLDAIRSRVAEIELWVARGELPTTCSQADGDGCPFRYLHAPTEERVVLDDPMLADYLHAYTDLTTVIAAGEKAKKQRDQLARPEIPVGRYSVDGVDLTVFEQKGRTSLDEDKLRANDVNPDDYKVTGPPSIRWKIS